MDYSKNFEAVVLPFYQSAGVTGEFTGVGGVKISYRKFEVANERGAIVFCPGKGESYLTYPELEYDLAQAGFSVYVIDHRSQGFSGRLTADSQVVTVESYDNYVTDFTTFIDTIVNDKPHAHRYLLTNSMGGAIGAIYLATHPDTFERAVLSVPMFAINTKGFPEPVARELARIETGLGHGDQYAKLGGEKPYDFDHHSDCNGDGHQERRCQIENLVRANPASASGGSSYRWVYQSLTTTRWIRNSKLGTRVRIPLLIFQAERDELVLPQAQNDFCDQAAHCLRIAFPGASHEILTERDDIRGPAVRATIEFFGGQAP